MFGVRGVRGVCVCMCAVAVCVPQKCEGPSRKTKSAPQPTVSKGDVGPCLALIGTRSGL